MVALALLASACGPTHRQRQQMMLASEERAEAAAAAKKANGTGPTGIAVGAPGTVGPAGPASAVPGTAADVDLMTYRLAPGDLIDIKFPFHPEENQRAPVRSDGRINLPIAGDIPAAGYTVDELEASIVEKASARLRGPEVSIVLTQLAEHKVFVGGQVGKPGFVVFRPGMTAMQAIVERGGFVDDSKMDQVVHIHRVGDQAMNDKIDLKDAFEGKTEDRTALAPNDILIVPRTFIGDADVFVDQWIRGLLPSIPRPGIDLPLLFF